MIGEASFYVTSPHKRLQQEGFVEVRKITLRQVHLARRLSAQAP
ncbi:hypothetical protein [Polaromonas sp.]